MDKDEYEELIKELVSETGLDYNSVEDVVLFLQREDLLDQTNVYNRYVGDE